ncbi:hypothetical protein F66182_226 [Fusarium sp. NRRL 66182]|nr:hypothetical protein F66182_226 [Fusarium sp. NRRL 66182]
MARGKKAIKPTLQNKRRHKREASISPTIKLEGDELMDDFPLFPGLFGTDQYDDAPDDLLFGTDSLSLKGQVWPGMGKMDLANDEMKRTRNQRKPKSVIERMKKASECIEPTQVIMTPELKVERMKDVYDDTSSPVPGQEESPPKHKRKKPIPLAEISGNIPKHRRTAMRGSKSNTGKRTSNKKETSHQKEPVTFPSPVQLKQGHDIFRDDVNFPDTTSEPPLPHNHRFDLRSRHEVQNMDNFLQHDIVSPTPHSKDLASRQPIARERPSSLRPESFPPGSFSHIEASYAMKDATIYNASSRLPFSSTTYNQFRGFAPDHFRMAASYGFQLKQEDYSGSFTGDSAHGTNNSPFVGMSGTNTLFAQDPSFLSSYNQGTPNTTFTPLSFSSINEQQEHSHNDPDVKPQTHMCDVVDSNGLCGEQDLDINGSWSLHASNHDLDFPL